MVILQKRVAGLTEDSLDRFVTRAKRLAGLRGSVTVLVTSSLELRRLNQRFRGKDKPTDVLSFPPEPVAARGFAGDLAISAEIAAQNARRLGHSPAEEIKILVLHGVLHLTGYDHESDNGEMARREERLRKELRLPIALIERGETRATKSSNRRIRGGTPQRTPRNAKSHPQRSIRYLRRHAR
jgi:probable rRNA maturation factor